jgi:hypothetical protein
VRKLLVASSIVLLLLSGCLGAGAPPAQPKPQPAPTPAALAIADYFPVSIGSKWKFGGWGNEFAPFEREITHRSGDKVQLQDATGGTTVGFVLRVNEAEVRIIYGIEEHYDKKNLLDRQPNRDVLLLKAPLREGEKWESAGSTRSIEKTALDVVVPSGLFKNCIQIKSVRADSEWTTYEYYAPGVGLIKRENAAGENVVISDLHSYSIAK